MLTRLKKILLSIPLLCLLAFAQHAYAISIELDGTRSLVSGAECGISLYRFGTHSSYNGQALDILIEVTATDNEHAESNRNCVTPVDNFLAFSIRDKDNNDDIAYIDATLYVVEQGGTIANQVIVDRLLLTMFDLDSNTIDTGEYVTGTDDIYVNSADAIYLGPNSNISALPGNYANTYDMRFEGQTFAEGGNCNDSAASPELACRASAIWTQTSSIQFRVQNDNAYGLTTHATAYRLFQLSLKIEDLNALIAGAEDYGDARAEYAATSHIITGHMGLGEGLLPDPETTNQPSANADGDDNDTGGANHDDEDGIYIDGATLSAQTLNAGSTVDLQVNTFGKGYVNAWFDWNGDFDFNDPGEQVITNRIISNSGESVNGATVNAATNAFTLSTVTITVPENAIGGSTVARFKFTENIDPGATGINTSIGEVEDYAVTIIPTYTVSGKVFNDKNVSASYNAGEAGINNITVILDNQNGVCRSIKTSGGGNYSFRGVKQGTYSLYEASNETVPVPAVCASSASRDPQGYRSSSVNHITVTVNNADMANQNFADVQAPLFSPNHSGDILPGATAFYAHQFTARSNGSVTLNTVNSSTITSGWSMQIYQDINCDGQLNGADANTILSTSFNVQADETTCMINKIFAPSGILQGEQFINAIKINFLYGNALADANSTLLSVTDITTASVSNAGDVSKLELRKTVKNISLSSAETEVEQAADPGNILEYRIYYRNTGTGSISEVMLNDTVQPFTTLISASAACFNTPANMVCIPVENDPDISWGFTGTLAGGAQGYVSFRVQID